MHEGTKIIGVHSARDNRTRVTICDEDGNKTTLFYYTYLIEIHLGRKLETNEIVHHKDGNCWNNEISNLEVMTQSEHMKIHRPCKSQTFICPICNNQFTLVGKKLSERLWHKRKNNSPWIYCSRSCSGKGSHYK